MKHKTGELTGALLDEAVRQCLRDPVTGNVVISGSGRFHEDWASAGPIIERERIRLLAPAGGITDLWAASTPGFHGYAESEMPLVAAMRAYVASKLGEEVEL